MDLNPLAEYVYGIIQEKGFHDIQHSQIETLTFRQLLHLVTEWGEMFLVETGRGCSRGCRFCAAGHVYRPVVFHPADLVEEACATESAEQGVGGIRHRVFIEQRQQQAMGVLGRIGINI